MAGYRKGTGWVRREYQGVSGDTYCEYATGPDDITPGVKHTRLGCDKCFLNIAHSEALCARERAATAC